MDDSKKTLSIVIPVFNEEGSITGLIEEIVAVLPLIPSTLQEVIFIDDASEDLSVAKIKEGLSLLPIKCIQLRKRSGKSHALAVGFRQAKGDYILTMDGDLQDDPAEIPKLIHILEQGFDLVSGWKFRRMDPLSKQLPSRFFNFMLRKLFSVPLHDFNCGLKIYRRHALNDLKMYGDLHRFIPIFLFEAGFKITEVKVNHRSRLTGTSKYGVTRLFTGALDCLTVIAVTRFVHDPGHFFGGIGAFLALVGSLTLGYLGVLWCLDAGPIGTRPLFFLAILAILLSVQFVFFGVLAEIIVRLLFRDIDTSRIAEIFPKEDDLPT